MLQIPDPEQQRTLSRINAKKYLQAGITYSNGRKPMTKTNYWMKAAGGKKNTLSDETEF